MIIRTVREEAFLENIELLKHVIVFPLGSPLPEIFSQASSLAWIFVCFSPHTPHPISINAPSFRLATFVSINVPSFRLATSVSVNVPSFRLATSVSINVPSFRLATSVHMLLT